MYKIITVAYSLKEIVPLQQVGKAPESNSRYDIGVLCPRAGSSLQAQELVCNSAEGRSSTANSGTKASGLPGIE